MANNATILDLLTCEELNGTCSECLTSEKCLWLEPNGTAVGGCVDRLSSKLAELLDDDLNAISSVGDCQDVPFYANYIKIASIILVIAFVTVVVLVFIGQKVRPLCARRADAAANNKDKEVQEPMVSLNDTTTNNT